MPRLADLLDPDVRARYPEQTLDPRARAYLNTEIPPDIPEHEYPVLKQFLQARVPNMTIAASNPMASAHQVETRARYPHARTYSEAAEKLAGYKMRSRAGQLVEQAGAGALETLPSTSTQPRALQDRTPQTPQPHDFAEEVARGAGQATAYGAEALATAMVPILRPLSAGLPALLQAGTGKERAISATTMEAMGGLAHGAEGLVGKVAGPVAAKVAGVPIGAATFGLVAPYAEALAHRLTGDQVEMPRLEDVVRSVGALGIINAATAGGGTAIERGARTATRMSPAEDVPQRSLAAPIEPQRPATPTVGPAARLAAVQPLAQLEPDAAKLVWGIAKGNGGAGPKGRLDMGRRNPLDGNRSELESFSQRVQATLAGVEKPTPEQYKAAATQARRQVKGMTAYWSVVREPHGGTPELKAAGDAVSKRWTDYLGGKGITLRTEDGQVVAGRVAMVLAYPWAPQQFRVVLQDGQTGQVVPLAFRDASHFQERVLSIGRDLTQQGGGTPTPGPAERVSKEAAPSPDLFSQAPLGRGVEEKVAAPGPRPAPEKRGSAPRARGTEAQGTAAERAPLPQTSLGVGAPEVPTTSKARASVEGERAVREMAGEVRSFGDHFAELVKKGTPAEEARAEAERLSGEAAPRGFDAEARAKSTLHRAAEEAGQASLFGGAPEPTPAKRGEPAAVPERREPVAPAGHVRMYHGGVPGEGRAWLTPDRAYAEGYARKSGGVVSYVDVPEGHPGLSKAFDDTGTSTKAPYVAFEAPPELAARLRPVEPIGRATAPPLTPEESRLRERVGLPAESGGAVAGTTRAQSLHMHESFQQRETGETDLVDKDRIQAYLQRHEGYSAEEMAKHPITVWRDTNGELGPAGRVYVIDGHHRTYIAQRTWAKNEAGNFVETSVSDREVPTVEIHGDYAHAQEQARVANLAGAPNTMVEKAKIARALSDQGKTTEQVAAQVTQGKGAQARDLISLSHLDPELQRQFFGEKGLPLSVGAYLGDFAKRHNVHPEHQRPWLQRLASKEIASLDDLKSELDGYMRVLAAANQTSLLSQMDMGQDALTPGQAHTYLGRVMRAAGKAERDAKGGARAAKLILKRGGSTEELKSAETLLVRYQRDLDVASRIQKEAEVRATRAVKESLEGGGRLADALQKVNDWIEQQLGPHAPDERGSTTLFTDMAASANQATAWLSRQARKGIRRAVLRYLQSRGKGANEVRLQDPDGHVRTRFRLDEAMDDPYVTEAAIRMAANARTIGGREILTPELALERMRTTAREAMWDDFYRDQLEAAWGSRETARYFAAFGSGAIELGKALRGEPHNIPSQHVGAVARIKALLDTVHALEVAHAHEMEQPVPRYRTDYGHPHIVEGTRSDPLSKFYELVELRGAHEISEAEMKERRNRFYNRREGDPNYIRDATYSIQQRIRESSRKMSHDPYLAKVSEYLRSEASLDDPKRAGLVRDLVRTDLFRNKGKFEAFVDDAFRSIFFSKIRKGIQDVPLADVAQRLGTTVEALNESGVDRASYVPAGVSWRGSGGAHELGKTAGGGSYVGFGENGTVFSSDAPIARPIIETLAGWNADKLARITGRLSVPEERLRHNARVADWIQRFEHDPAQVAAGMLTGGVSKAVLGYNVAAATINSMQTLITTLPEYGPRAYMEGARGATRAVQQQVLRRGIDAMERVGWLSREDAETARKSLPLLREEIYAEAAGVHQGEVRAAEERLRDITEGRDPELMRVLRALGPYGMFSAAEGWNRTLGILAADSYARRERGLKAQAPDVYDNMMSARQQMLDAMANPNSAESFASMGVLNDQFGYNILGQPMWAQGPMGKILFQLGTWPLNYAKRYVARSTISAARVARAAATGAREVGFRGGDWWERWMEHGGASRTDQHLAAIFMRQMGVSAVLTGLAAATTWNVANFGTAPQFVALMWMLRQFFPDDDTMAKWYETGAKGLAVDPNRGIPFGPAVKTAVSLATETGSRIRKAGEEPGTAAAAYFPWDTVLEAVRHTMLTGSVEWERWVRENPEWFRDMPWVFKVMGVKRTLPEMTPMQHVRSHVRMMTPQERRELEEKASE